MINNLQVNQAPGAWGKNRLGSVCRDDVPGAVVSRVKGSEKTGTSPVDEKDLLSRRVRHRLKIGAGTCGDLRVYAARQVVNPEIGEGVGGPAE